MTDYFNRSKKKDLINSLSSKPFFSISSDFTVEELYNILSKNPYLVNTEDENNETFLSYAIKRNNTDIIDLLLTSPILNLTYQNELTGNTYLHLAVLQQNIKLIKELLDKNIYIDIQNNDGNTALHLAYYINNIKIIKLLLENDIDFGIKNKKGLIAEEIDPIDNINNIAGYDINSNSGETTKYKSSLKTKNDKEIKKERKKILSNGLDYLFEDNKNESIDKKENIYINNFDIKLSNEMEDNLKTIQNDEEQEKDFIELNNQFINLSTINQQNYSNKKEKEIKCDNKPLYEFLSQINMQKYYDNLNNNGFEYINMVIDDIKLGNYLTDEQLKMIGILIPGDRAKILIRLEEKSNLFDFNVPKNVYYCLNNLEKIELDINVIKLNNWLKNIKLEQYLKSFIDNGYYSLDLLLMQSLSKNPLNNDVLKNELNIEKLGHRTRILNKLKEDSKKYIINLRNSLVTFHTEENSKICSECFIF